MRLKAIIGIVFTVLLIGMLTLTFNIAHAQPPEIEWTKTYGDEVDDVAYSVVETVDGGYALAGRARLSAAGGHDFWLVKVAGPPTPVGGVWVPVDKLGLLAPYIGLVSTILVATAATAIYVKHVKRRKEKQ